MKTWVATNLFDMQMLLVS